MQKPSTITNLRFNRLSDETIALIARNTLAAAQPSPQHAEEAPALQQTDEG